MSKRIILLILQISLSKELFGPAVKDRPDDICSKIGNFSNYTSANGSLLQPFEQYSRVWRYPSYTQTIIRKFLSQLLAPKGSSEGISNVYNGGQFPTLPNAKLSLAEQIDSLKSKSIKITMDSDFESEAPFIEPNTGQSVEITKPTLKALADSPRIFLSSLFFPESSDFTNICRFAGDGVDNRQDKRLLDGENSFLSHLIAKKKESKDSYSLTSSINSVDSVNKLVQESLEVTTSIDLLSLASGVAITSDVLFLIEQKVVEGKARYKFRNGTLPAKGEAPITMISIPGINANYGAKYLQDIKNAQLWLKLFLNMWATILGSAVEKGCRILCAPLISGGAFLPKSSPEGFLTCNFLALGLLLATDEFKSKFDRIYLNPLLFRNQAIWDRVFGPNSPLVEVLTDKKGPLVPFGGDTMFLAIELAKSGYKVACLNPSDADVSYGLRPLGQYVLHMSPNPEASDMVGEESIGLFSTMILASRGIGMFKLGDKIVSLYESPDKIKLLSNWTDILKSLMFYSQFIDSIISDKDFSEDLKDSLSRLVLGNKVAGRAITGLREGNPLTTTPEEASQMFGLSETDANQRAQISIDRALQATRGAYQPTVEKANAKQAAGIYGPQGMSPEEAAQVYEITYKQAQEAAKRATQAQMPQAKRASLQSTPARRASSVRISDDQETAPGQTSKDDYSDTQTTITTIIRTPKKPSAPEYKSSARTRPTAPAQDRAALEDSYYQEMAGLVTTPPVAAY